LFLKKSVKESKLFSLFERKKMVFWGLPVFELVLLLKFDSLPYISGWVSVENLDRINGAPVVSVQSVGQGKLISYHEDLNFRGFWLGTNKLFSNSVFFGKVIR